MIAAWIVITLMFAVVIGFIFAMTGREYDRFFTFVAVTFWVCGVSFTIAVIYVAIHFINKYW